MQNEYNSIAGMAILKIGNKCVNYFNACIVCDTIQKALFL